MNAATKLIAVAILVVLLTASTAAARCVASPAAKQPAAPPAPPGGQSAPAVATAAPLANGDFYLAYAKALYKFVYSSGATVLTAGALDTPPTSVAVDGVGNAAVFEMMTASLFVTARTALFVVDSNKLRRIEDSTRLVTTLVTNSAITSGSRLASNDSHVFVSCGACVYAVDVTRTNGWTFDLLLGNCAAPAAADLTSPQVRTASIREVLALGFATPAIVVGTATQLILYMQDRDRLEVGPSFPAQNFQSLTTFPSLATVSWFSGGCDIKLVQAGSEAKHTMPQSQPDYCAQSSTFVLGFSGTTPSSTTDFYAMVRSASGTQLMQMQDCGLSNAQSITDTTVPTAPPAPTNATTTTSPTPNGNSGDGEGSNSSTTIIVVVVIVGAVLLVVVVIVVVVLYRRMKPAPQELHAMPPAHEGTEMETRPPQKTASYVGSSASPSTAASPWSTMTKEQPPGAASTNSSGKFDGHRVVVVSEHDDHDPSMSTIKHSAIQSFPGAAGDSGGLGLSKRQNTNPHLGESNTDISAQKRSLHQSALANSGVVVSAVSRGDFAPNASDSDARFGVRVWNDAELRRHNKRCQFVAEGAYQKGKLLGRGANGAVFAVLLKDGSTIAMKEVHLMGSEDEIRAQMNEVEREMDLLSRLHHDNLVTYYGVTCDRAQLLVKLFMENVTGGSLGAMVRGMDERIPEETAQLFTLQLVRGLAFLHNKGIVHRDLKCDNILRDAHTGKVKLADFGTAKTVGTSAMASRAAQTMIGTPYFMAPEILMAGMGMTEGPEAEDASQGYGAKADVWSLGITVAELLNRGNPPWPNFPSPGHAFLYIGSPQGVPIMPEGLSAECQDFIRQCTKRNPRERPATVQMLDHPWIRLVTLDDDAEDNE
jgi:serine/threonine protein kinase